MRQEQNGYANLVLDSELKACKPPLSPRDTAFASGIFYTVLERRSLLDWMLAQFPSARWKSWMPLCGPSARRLAQAKLWMFRCLRLSMNRSS